MMMKIEYLSLEPVMDVLPLERVTQSNTREADIPVEVLAQWAEIKRQYDNMQHYLKQIYFADKGDEHDNG